MQRKSAIALVLLAVQMQAAMSLPIGHQGAVRQRDLVVAVSSKAPQTKFDKLFHERARGERDHLALEEVCRLLGPSTASIDAVKRWANFFGAVHVTATRSRPSFSHFCPLISEGSPLRSNLLCFLVRAHPSLHRALSGDGTAKNAH